MLPSRALIPITIRLGKWHFTADSVFTMNGEPTAALAVCIGITTHDRHAKAFSNSDKHWIAAWETMNDQSELGTGAILDSGKAGKK